MEFKQGKKWVDKNGAKCNMGFGRTTKNTRLARGSCAVFRQLCRHPSPVLAPCWLVCQCLCLYLCLCLCLCLCEWSRAKGRAGAHHVPLKSLCPVAERIVAAVHLASGTPRSFRHSSGGRPPSLPAALLPLASLRSSESSPRPNLPLSCKEMPLTPTPHVPFPHLLVFVRSACAAASNGQLPDRRLRSQGECVLVQGDPMRPRRPVVP